MAYADPILNAAFQSAIRDIQGLEANKVIIQGASYSCVLGVALFQQVFEGGGPMRSVQNMTCSVLKSDFVSPPVIGNLPVTARGTTWRVIDVKISAMTYDLTLESVNK